MNIIPVVTIDGTSGSGKSTICQAIANKLKWNLLDSGSIYRSLVFSALYNYKININSENDVAKIAQNLNLSFITNVNSKDTKVILDGQDVTLKIRTQEISQTASYLASFPKVRHALLYRQRNFRKYPGLIADGRDMGTVIFPDALIKIFLDASLEQRVNRRLIQLRKQGFDVNFKSLVQEIQDRDTKDSNRIISPLKPAIDALVLDTSDMSATQVFSKIITHIIQYLKM